MEVERKIILKTNKSHNIQTYSMVQKNNILLEQASELVSLEEFDEALHIYNKVLRSDPSNTSALIDKAATLQRIGKNHQALKLFDRAL